MLYEHVLKRLYPDSGALCHQQQAILLGMYLLRLAEDIQLREGPVTVVVAHSGQIQELPTKNVQHFQERIDIFRSQADALLCRSRITQLPARNMKPN